MSTKRIKTGGPAFPEVRVRGGDNYNPPTKFYYGGMTLRDYFAAKAMQGIISLGSNYTYTKEDMDSGTPADAIARYSYQVADAMLAAREATTDVAGLEEAPINVVYTDGCGASRRSPADCRYGVRYVTIADTVYWPLSANDAQRLRSAECGRGDFTGPANECPDVSALVEALEKIANWADGGSEYGQDKIKAFALAALAGKGGE